MSFSNGLDKRPKLRFPEFDEPYRVVTLGEISFMIKRSDPQSHAPVMMLSAGNGFIMQSDKYSRDNAGQSLKKYILLKKGELAYNHGASKAKQFGCCYELQEEEARIPYVYHCFKVRDTEYTPYVALELNNPKMDKQLKRLVSSSVRMDGLLNISYEEYMSVQVYLPAYSEQKRIADFIEKLDKRTVKQEQLIETLKKYKRGLLQYAFPQKGEVVPQLRFAGFSGDWERRKISDMFKVTRGYVLAATLTEENQTDEMPYPVYSSQTKDDGLMGYYKDFLYENAITWTTDGANAGTVNYRAGKFYCTNVCGVLISNEVKTSKMIAEALNNVAKNYVSYVGNPKLMNNVMADIEIMIPVSSLEQEKVSNLFAVLDNLITLHQRRLDNLTKYKKGLLQQLFI